MRNNLRIKIHNVATCAAVAFGLMLLASQADAMCKGKLLDQEVMAG